MERPSRRSSNGSSTTASGSSSSKSNTTTNSSNSNNTSSSSRRRRREAAHTAESEASLSDGAETDSSSVVMELGKRSAGNSSSSSTNKKSTSDRTKEKNKKALVNGNEEEEEEGEDHEEDPLDSGNANKKAADATTPEPIDEQDDHVGADGEHEEEQQEEDEEEDEEPVSTGYATRARRERSQSVVSTTSDTSSIASDHTIGAADDESTTSSSLHAEKLAELEKKKKMVEDGTLAEYCRRVAEFKEERNRLLQTAEWHKKLQLKNTQDLYGFEIQCAHNIWQDAKDKTKTTLLAKMDALRGRLHHELDHLKKTGELPKYVVVEQKTLIPPQPQQTQQTPPSPKRRKISAPMPDNVMRLPLDAVTSDLMDILQARDAASTRIHAALPTPQLALRVDRRRLLCGKYVFEEGDEVVVTAAILKQDYIGVISSVSDQEIYVMLSTGQKVRVAIDHIAHRRCEIRPFLRGSAGIESFQSSGWVECEPF